MDDGCTLIMAQLQGKIPSSVDTSYHLSIIGAITFYRDMFPARSHVLNPLTSQAGKQTLQWNDECQKAFDTIKVIIAQDILLRSSYERAKL